MNFRHELERLYPDASDRLVRWNIRSEQGHDGIELWQRIYGKVVDSDPFTYLGTTEWIDEDLCEDPDRVKRDLFDVMQSHIASVPGLSSIVFDVTFAAYRGEVMSLLSPVDRTLEIPIREPGIYDVQLFNRLRQYFFSKWPQWRLHIVGNASDGEESLMIYEKVVRLGCKCCPPDDLEVALGEWSRAISEIRERRLGPARRQWKCVENKLPDLLLQVSERNPVLLVCAFDNRKGDFSRYNLWFLQLFEHTLPAEDVGWTATHCLDRNGVPMTYDPELTPYELVQCTIPKNRDLAVKLEEVEGDRAWAFRLKSDEVIADKDLLE